MADTIPQKTEKEKIIEFKTSMLSLVLNRLADVTLPQDIREINEKIKESILNPDKDIKFRRRL